MRKFLQSVKMRNKGVGFCGRSFLAVRVLKFIIMQVVPIKSLRVGNVFSVKKSSVKWMVSSVHPFHLVAQSPFSRKTFIFSAYGKVYLW